MNGESSIAAPNSTTRLARRLGLFDAAMIVMGGIIGSGIFMNPYVVARRVHTIPLILGCWLLGGLVALGGAFIYAELAAQRPYLVGGQYAYLREAYHPAVGFVYGWALLLVIQTGGMAAVAVTFAGYFREITHLQLDGRIIAALTLCLLSQVTRSSSSTLLMNFWSARQSLSAPKSNGSPDALQRTFALTRVILRRQLHPVPGSSC